MSGDASEAQRCLHDLSVPHYNHEAVARALRLAAEGGPEAAVPAVLRLLRHLAASGEVNETQMRIGFDRVLDGLEDLTLDCPAAKDLVPSMEAAALAEGWLKPSEA